MTTGQIQHLLTYLGYSPGGCDGVYGDNTKAAIKAFQRQEGLTEDGIAGTATQARLKEAVFQGKFANNIPASGEPPNDTTEDAAKYLQADGFYHIPRGINVRLTKNFWSSEIHCQGVGCCTESVISKRTMDTTQAIRDDLGEPLEIGGAGGSGYRCPAHNKAAGGAARSLHLLSEAVDLHYKDPAKLKTVAMRHVADGEIGLYDWGIHLGCWDRGYVSQFYK